MSDTPLTHADLPLYGRQVLESSVETDVNGQKYSQPLPGFYEIYTVIDGVDVVLDRRKAPGLLADITRAQKAGYTPPPPPSGAPSPQQADTSALEARLAALEAAQQSQQSQQSAGEQTQQSSGDQPPPAPPAE